MWVVKLGGSLGDAPVLRRWLAMLAQQGQGKIVIVPGGGAFAEQVRIAQRHWRFDDITAHRMAILAMQQMALMLRALNTDLCLTGSVAGIYTALAENNAVLWSPDNAELDRAAIPAVWDITSDSLAAWLAGEMRAAALILVKSAPIPEKLTLAELGEQGIVDKAFAGYAQKLGCPVRILHRDDIAVCASHLTAQLHDR